MTEKSSLKKNCQLPPFFSVITAAYRYEPFLQRYFQSLASQTFQNFEVLLCFRHDSPQERKKSLEKVWKAAEELTKKEITCRIFEDEKNLGQGAARNLAAQNAQGESLAVLDIDDEWMPEKLELCHQCFKQNPDIVVVFHDKVLCDSNGVEYQDCWDGRAINHRLLLFEDNKVSNSASTIRKESYWKLNGFDEGLREREDWDFWMRAAQFNLRFHHLPQILLRYHVHGNNLHLNNHERNREFMMKIFNDHYQQRSQKKQFDWVRYARMRSNLNRVFVSNNLRKKNYIQALNELIICFTWWPFSWKNIVYLGLLLFRKDKLRIHKYWREKLKQSKKALFS